MDTKIITCATDARTYLIRDAAGLIVVLMLIAVILSYFGYIPLNGDTIAKYTLGSILGYGFRLLWNRELRKAWSIVLAHK